MPDVSALAYYVYHQSLIGKSCPECGMVFLDRVDANSPIGPYTPIIYPWRDDFGNEEPPLICCACYYANHADEEWRDKYPQCKREDRDA